MKITLTLLLILAISVNINAQTLGGTVVLLLSSIAKYNTLVISSILSLLWNKNQ